MASNHSLGRWGESLARQYLERCGYHCLEAGFRIPGGEIDLIMVRGEVLVIVEVKTRGPQALASPESWVDGRKLRLMRRTVREFLACRPEARGRYIRLDVVAIQDKGEGRGLVLRHLRAVR